MFTGIIQDIGVVKSHRREGGNINLEISSHKLVAGIAVGDSVSISGVCLTATDRRTSERDFAVTAVAESIKRTTLATLRIGDSVNLELALRAGDRLGGHYVQGHIDTTGKLLGVRQTEGSWLMTFTYPEDFAQLLIEKGSIAIDGVSLTAFECDNNQFSVSTIPQTWKSTTLSRLQPGDRVNLEFDLIGKYVLNYRKRPDAGELSLDKLRDSGY
jgi:riboflavin synthase